MTIKIILVWAYFIALAICLIKGAFFCKFFEIKKLNNTNKLVEKPSFEIDGSVPAMFICFGIVILSICLAF
jgi:hypothetical protein